MTSESSDSHRLRALRYSVVVSTPDFESGNPGSNPGTAIQPERARGCSAVLRALVLLLP